MITVLDYGMGNLGSILNMLKRIGVKACIESDPSVIEKADKLILPGVGAFDAAVNRINSLPNFRSMLQNKVMIEKTPILGVCLGMQLLLQSSEEGSQSGLGWIPGKTKRFPKLEDLKVPHMGWNVAKINNPSQLTEGIDVESRYYFVHSFFVQVDNPQNSLMRSHYGINFDSAIGNENIYGVQFHPEKSHRFGMQILKNFSEI